MSKITAEQIAIQAASLVGGDRARTHGNKLDNHKKIAEIWNGIMAAAGKKPFRPLDAHDVANLMEGMKIARRYSGSFNPDDYIDGAGYSSVAGEIMSEQIRMDEAWAEAALEGGTAAAWLERQGVEQ